MGWEWAERVGPGVGRGVWILAFSCFAAAACGDSDGAAKGDAAMSGGSDGGGHGDGDGQDAGGGSACSSDAECDDGVHCNGGERCADGRCAAGDAPDCDDGIDCTRDACDEELQACRSSAPDADSDGHADATCVDGDGEPLGDDCDDTDPNRFPGNEEVCDVAAHDEDCDARTFGFRDADRDGSPDELCCNVDPDGERICGNDCDDAQPAVSRTNTEACDGVDNDCDGMTDEQALLTFYRDADGDNFGDPDGETRMACAPPSGFVFNQTDCDDGIPTVNPGRFDVCDELMLDDDCSGVPNDPDGGCTCTGTGTRACAACVGPEGACVGECSGSTQRCQDGQWLPCILEPGNETCDGRDEDCDGITDEGFDFVSYFRDADGDGYGNPDVLEVSCDGVPAGGGPWVTNDDDCFDANDLARPGQKGFFAADRGDGRFDYDCDGREQAFHPVAGYCRYEQVLSNCVWRMGYAGEPPSCGAAYTAIVGCELAGETCNAVIGTGAMECR